MKLTVSKLVACGVLALAVPLLSACYATVGTDGRTYLQPMGYGSAYTSGYAYDVSRGYGYRRVMSYSGYGTAYGTAYGATPQGYTYYMPTILGTGYTTIPATREYTSFPIVSRKIVTPSDTCIVRPKPRRSCD